MTHSNDDSNDNKKIFTPPAGPIASGKTEISRFQRTFDMAH